MNTASNIQFTKAMAKDFIWEPSITDQVILRWLGQAGFEMFFKDIHLMIDPYLSDFLAKKYKGKESQHIRMMLSPLVLSEIKDLDFLLCTHRHSDHMDPETILILLENCPRCKIIAPEAEREYVFQIGVKENQVIFVNENDDIKFSSDFRVEVLPSAHEELKTDQNGNHYYLGYILMLGDLRIYHSGDCAPFVGLEQMLRKEKVDIALLPVNGRDEFRRSIGILGNFTFEEAVALCESANIAVMICHHFGMFDFNTIDEVVLKEKATDATNNKFTCIVPKTENVYKIKLR